MHGGKLGDQMKCANDEDFGCALDPIQERLESTFEWDAPQAEWRNFLTTSEVLSQSGVERPTQAELNRAASFIKKRGGNKIARRVKGATIRGYLMPESCAKLT
jgi:fructose-bisphosphate aldolase class 1